MEEFKTRRRKASVAIESEEYILELQRIFILREGKCKLDALIASLFFNFFFFQIEREQKKEIEILARPV